MIDLRYLFRDRPEPGTARQIAFTFPSGGDTLIGRCLLPQAGEETAPAVLMLHGFPGHEQNRDLAQALRRIGFAVVTFSYRGNWGSGGTYRLGNLGEDAASALRFLRARAEEWGVDAARVFTVAHSMGGFASMQLLASGERTRGSVLMAPCDAAAMYLHAGQDFAALIQTASAYVRLGADGPDGLARECEAHGEAWTFPALAEAVNPDIPLLLIGAARDGVTPPGLHLGPLKAALLRRGMRVAAEEFDDVHTFDSSRVRLTETVAGWLADRV